MKRLLLLAACTLLSVAAFAENINTTTGTLTVIEGTAPLGAPLSYLSGGDGLVGIDGCWPGSGCPGPYPSSPADAMNNYDHQWLQFDPAIIMYSSTALDSVFAIPGIDHGPNPEENLEFIIYGCIDTSGTFCEQGTIKAIYRNGFDAFSTTDDYTSLWGFTRSYNYFKITSGDLLDPHYGSQGEGEIDALAAPVPEPGTLVLLGSGLAGLAGSWKTRFLRK